jgi:hypothetical protein
MLDVQQDRKARHAVREARGQLCGDDAADSRSAKEITVASHWTTLLRRAAPP